MNAGPPSFYSVLFAFIESLAHVLILVLLLYVLWLILTGLIRILRRLRGVEEANERLPTPPPTSGSDSSDSSYSGSSSDSYNDDGYGSGSSGSSESNTSSRSSSSNHRPLAGGPGLSWRPLPMNHGSDNDSSGGPGSSILYPDYRGCLNCRRQRPSREWSGADEGESSSSSSHSNDGSNASGDNGNSGGSSSENNGQPFDPAVLRKPFNLRFPVPHIDQIPPVSNSSDNEHRPSIFDFLIEDRWGSPHPVAGLPPPRSLFDLPVAGLPAPQPFMGLGPPLGPLNVPLARGVQEGSWYGSVPIVQDPLQGRPSYVTPETSEDDDIGDEDYETESSISSGNSTGSSACKPFSSSSNGSRSPSPSNQLTGAVPAAPQAPLGRRIWPRLPSGNTTSLAWAMQTGHEYGRGAMQTVQAQPRPVAVVSQNRPTTPNCADTGLSGRVTTTITRSGRAVHKKQWPDEEYY